MNQHQFNDLAELAIDRCRESAMSVGQLMDDDLERASLLMTCASDMIEGAVCLIEDDEITEDQALSVVISMLFMGIGAERIQKAIKDRRPLSQAIISRTLRAKKNKEGSK